MIKALKFICVFMFVITALISNIWAGEIGTKKIIANEYLQQSKEFKKDLQVYLETLRLELYDKKYPQAYFIKSLQGQISEYTFLDMNELKNTKEQIFSLNQSIKSQYNANSALKTISAEKLEMYLDKIYDLQVLLKAQNHLVPEFINSSFDVSRLSAWTRFEHFANSLSALNQATIFFTVFAGWIFLFGRRKLQDYKSAAKTVTRSVRTKADKNLPSKNNEAETEAEQFRHLENNKFLSLLRVNASGVVVYSNKTFKNTFGEATLWKAFFDGNLSFDKTSPANSNIYSAKNSSKKYLMTISEKDKKGLKTIFIQEVPSREDFVAAPINHTGQFRAENQIVSKTTQIDSNENQNEILSDIFETSISKYPGLSASVNIHMSADEFDVVSKSEKIVMEAIANDISKFMYNFIKNKNIKTHVTLRFDETENRHLVTFFVSQTTIRPEEMSAPFSVGKHFSTLNKILKDLKLNYKDQELELKVKNIHQTQNAGFYVDISFNKDVKTSVKPTTRSTTASM